jgi:lysophospholipase L1-like esterase
MSVPSGLPPRTGRRWSARQNRPTALVTALALAAALGVWLGAAPAAAGIRAEDRANPGPNIVGLGDSVVAAKQCHCPGMLDGYGRLVSNATEEDTIVDNYGLPNATSAVVLDQLGAPAIEATIRGSDVVVIMVGADDFDGAFKKVAAGAPAKDQYTPVAGRLEANLTHIIGEVRQLHGGQRVPVIVCDYWNVYKDGLVAQREYPAAKRAAAAAATKYANGAIERAASKTGATLLSTYKLFRDGGKLDPLLGPDGNHPSAVGYQRIAQALYWSLPRPAGSPTAGADGADGGSAR